MFDEESARQAHLVRCILGNPFRAPTLRPHWLSANDGAVHRIAQTIYDDRAFADLPVLADALEEAGCDDAVILAHCRDDDLHARGCWVIDSILGKS